jgi:benzil reductase ((S)-benzoin forming)
VRESLVFVSGASSGIGEALVRTLPFAPARVFGVSRRGADGCTALRADLADPAAWPRVAELFRREMEGFAGERVVFVHCAGTLTPIGFAGEEDPAAYTRAVLLNAAAPQVLGDAFLRAARGTRAPCHLVLIGSGAARNVYEGWSSYGAGKAAVDQWVRTAGAEQELRGGRCRVLSVSPGIVATAMQEEIRATPPRRFPQVARFVELFEKGELREPLQVARQIWALLDRGLENGAVVDLRASEARSEPQASEVPARPEARSEPQASEVPARPEARSEPQASEVPARPEARSEPQASEAPAGRQGRA